jgi:organic hydroperoxide reductase OsmC/OhrA
MLTQVARYGHMMKVRIDKARMHVTARVRQEGSVMAQTVRGSWPGITTRLEVESQESPERIAGVLRNAENGCFVMQALVNPVAVERTVMVNGATFNMAAPR